MPAQPAYTWRADTGRKLIPTEPTESQELESESESLGMYAPVYLSGGGGGGGGSALGGGAQQFLVPAQIVTLPPPGMFFLQQAGHPQLQPQSQPQPRIVGDASVCSASSTSASSPAYVPSVSAVSASAPASASASAAARKKERRRQRKKAEKERKKQQQQQKEQAEAEAESGSRYIPPRHTTSLHVIRNLKVWQRRNQGRDFRIEVFCVGTEKSVGELIEDLLIEGEGEDGDSNDGDGDGAAVGWAVTEVVELGDGCFAKNGTVEYGSEAADKTLAYFGWNQTRGTKRPPVWLVLHMID